MQISSSYISNPMSKSLVSYRNQELKEVLGGERYESLLNSKPLLESIPGLDEKANAILDKMLLTSGLHPVEMRFAKGDIRASLEQAIVPNDNEGTLGAIDSLTEHYEDNMNTVPEFREHHKSLYDLLSNLKRLYKANYQPLDFKA